MTSDNDRIAYLMGEASTGIDPVEQAELADLRALLSDASIWDEPAPDLEDRVLASIADARTAERAPTAPGTEPAGAVLPPPSPEPVAPVAAPRAPESSVTPPSVLDRHRARRAGRRGWMLAALGTAAVLVLALGIGLAVSNRSDGPDFTVALAGTSLSPGASGTAKMTKTDSGWEIRLDASGLPRLDGGRFYQAWLRAGPDGPLVPVGSFNEPDGVILWAGVSPVDFSIFTVTQEAADGNQDSSGQRVLVGQVKP